MYQWYQFFPTAFVVSQGGSTNLYLICLLCRDCNLQCIQAADFFLFFQDSCKFSKLPKFTRLSGAYTTTGVGRYHPGLVCSATLEKKTGPLPNITLFKSLGGKEERRKRPPVICAMQNATNLVAPVTMNRAAWFWSIQSHLVHYRSASCYFYFRFG